MSGNRIYGHLLTLAILAAASTGIAGDAGKKDADALPDGAVQRLGSLRWRHGDPITFVAYPPDDKTLLTAGQDSVLRLWDRDTGKELRRFVPPANPKAKGAARISTYLQGLTRAALSKDGKLLAVSPRDDLIQLWDVETGTALRQIKGPVNGAISMAFAPDGKALVIRGANDRITYVYDTETGKEIRQLKSIPPGGKQGNIFGGAGDGTAIAISADGKAIACSELEFDGQRVSGSITLFDFETGKPIRRYESQTNGISAVALSPDRKLLVHNTYNFIVFLEAETGKEIRKINMTYSTLLIFAPDGQTLAVKSRDNQVKLYDANNGNLLRTFSDPPPKGVGFVTNSNAAIATDVAFSADGKTLVVGGQHMPRFYEVASGKEQTLTGAGHRSTVTSLVGSADAKHVVSRGADNLLRVWNRTDGLEIRQLAEPAGTSAVCFSPDGKLVALGNNDGSVRLLDVADGKQKSNLKAHQGSVAAVAFSADAKRIATRGAYDGVLSIFDAVKGTELKKIEFLDLKAGNNGNVIIRTSTNQRDGTPIAFSPDAKTVAIFVAPQQMIVQGRQQPQPDSNCLRFFDIATGKESRRIPMPAGTAIQLLAYSSDGRLLISENQDKTISLWEIASGQERSRLGEPVALTQSNVTSFVVVGGVARTGPAIAPTGDTFAISRDGSLIAAPGADHSIRIFDASRSKPIGAFKGHLGAVASLEFTADGKSLISGSNDTTILVWDLARLKREQEPQVAVLAKAFDTMWADLVGADAVKAGQSIRTLIAGSDTAVTLLKERVHPATPADAKKVEQWLRDLDSSDFKKRAIAARELNKLGELAIPALQKVLASQPSLEIRRRLEPLFDELTGSNLTPEQIRVVRAIEVLEKIGTDDARNLLERLAGGAAGALSTRHAQSALDRRFGNQ